MKKCLCQASPRVNLTHSRPYLPHRLSHLHSKVTWILLHTSILTYPCIFNLWKKKYSIFLIWKSSSGRFKRHKDERVGFKNLSTSHTQGVNSNTTGSVGFTKKRRNYHDKTLIIPDRMHVMNLHHKGCNLHFLHSQTTAKRTECYWLCRTALCMDRCSWVKLSVMLLAWIYTW